MVGFERITSDPAIMSGKACIRGMRISVSLIVSLVANGLSFEEIVEEYPDLDPKGIQEALRYAAWTVDDAIYLLNQPAVSNSCLIWAWLPLDPT